MSECMNPQGASAVRRQPTGRETDEWEWKDDLVAKFERRRNHPHEVINSFKSYKGQVTAKENQLLRQTSPGWERDEAVTDLVVTRAKALLVQIWKLRYWDSLIEEDVFQGGKLDTVVIKGLREASQPWIKSKENFTYEVLDKGGVSVSSVGTFQQLKGGRVIESSPVPPVSATDTSEGEDDQSDLNSGFLSEREDPEERPSSD